MSSGAIAEDQIGLWGMIHDYEEDNVTTVGEFFATDIQRTNIITHSDDLNFLITTLGKTKYINIFRRENDTILQLPS